LFADRLRAAAVSAINLLLNIGLPWLAPKRIFSSIVVMVAEERGRRVLDRFSAMEVQGQNNMGEPSTGSKTIKLAERRVFSHSFKPLYNEGMALVEHAAEYLDGQGRVEAKRLSRLAATLYSAESMRLTTRLMQIASWLLLQRAANSGEMSRDQVATEKAKVRLDTASAHADASGWAELPEAFVDLVNRSLSLQALVRRMDDEVYGKNSLAPTADARSVNPVSDQISLLNTAFARG
jgi:regulator of CtrA degradation